MGRPSTWSEIRVQIEIRVGVGVGVGVGVRFRVGNYAFHVERVSSLNVLCDCSHELCRLLLLLLLLENLSSGLGLGSGLGSSSPILGPRP